MQISPVKILFSNVQNIPRISKKELSFKADLKSEDGSKVPYFNVDMKLLLNNPVVSMYSQLIQDGFTTEEIKEAEIFQFLNVDPDVNFDYLIENMDEIAQNNDEIKSQIFKRSSKTPDDISAMLRAYKQLKQKFVTDDVIAYRDQMQEFHNRLKKMFGEKQKNNPDIIRQMALQVLRYVNRYNEPIVKALLDDKNFDNTNLRSALMEIDNQQNADCGLSVLKYAQDRGYNKDFSYPLAIIISQARPQNMDLIKRLIDSEQDFLSNNSDFTSKELINFLRLENPLLKEYLEDSEMSLETIYDIILADEDNQDLD